MTTEYLELKLHRRPHSPLFAHLASNYLEAGRVTEAVELCRAGLVRYPRYATAHIILARCLAAGSDYAAALAALGEAENTLPDSAMPAKLRSLWEPLLTARVAKRDEAVEQEDIAVGDHADSIADSAAIIGLIQPGGQPAGDTFPREAEPSEERIPDVPVLDGALGFAKPDHPENVLSAHRGDVVAASEQQSGEIAEMMEPGIEAWAELGEISDRGRIVSKTLAEIYATQRAYGEAIITYLLLKRQKPEHAAEFNARIQELDKIRIAKPATTSGR